VNHPPGKRGVLTLKRRRRAGYIPVLFRHQDDWVTKLYARAVVVASVYQQSQLPDDGVFSIIVATPYHQTPMLPRGGALTAAMTTGIARNMVTCRDKPAKAKKVLLKGTEDLRTL